MLDLLLMMTLGFLGSFGHCVGMCGPLTAAFSLSHKQDSPKWQKQLSFHILLNLGRLISYALVGASIGALGSILIAGGQMAGSGSALRRGIALFIGIMLIWFGILQVQPKLLPRIPLIHPLTQGMHNRLSVGMTKLSLHTRWWTPAALGIVWGLMPCGFLYAAQIKAAETGNMWMGAATMLTFGLGTLPTMLGVGVSTSLVSAARRSQLFRLAGWVTITVGILTLLRTGDVMGLGYYTGHASLILLMLALIARPICRFWSQPLQYRRALGVGAFVFALVHAAQAIAHTFGWDLNAISFLLPTHQIAIGMGVVAMALMTPAALTSFDHCQRTLGARWRSLHLLSVPALLLCVIHTVLIGSHYLGNLAGTGNQLFTVILVIITLGVLLVRSRWVWSLLSLDKFYAVPPRYK